VTVIFWIAAFVTSFMGIGRIWDHKDRWINVVTWILFLALSLGFVALAAS
jgi:hypothetical protein